MSKRRALIELVALLGITALLIYTPLYGVITDWFADRAADSITEVITTTTTSTTLP